ncbi:MAG: efflux RND transporter periplasmic adaptor subunit [Elusimicrobiales bacterium]|nr:efflux RND transporter periplasmic adaptor subunit [Elusimicrobiales bacterium]
MKKIIVIAAVLLAAGAGWWFYSHKKVSGKSPFQPVTARRGDITEIVDTTGDVEPFNRVVVKPGVGGRVDRLLVEEGDKVQRGQILAYLSSTDRVAIMDAARAKGPDELAKWEDTYKPTPVLSPLDGTVILRGVVQGQTIDTATQMFALSDDLIVVAQVDESDIGRIKEKQRAVITLDAYPGKKTEGTVFQILHEGVSVSNVITYNVKIRPDRVPANFKSEMSANIKVIINRKKGVVLLPITAITENPDGTRSVYKRAEGAKKPEPVKITTGIEDGENAEILSGVDEGETVYYRGYVPQQASASSSPFMPSGPGAGKSSTATNRAARRFQ